VFESFGYGLQCSHGVPCDSDHLRHRDRSLDSAGHTFSAHAPLPVADLHDAVVAANRGNRRKDTVFGDAVEERLGQVRIFAHIVAELQTVRSRCSTVPPSGVWGPSCGSVPYSGSAVVMVSRCRLAGPCPKVLGHRRHLSSATQRLGTIRPRRVGRERPAASHHRLPRHPDRCGQQRRQR
jgi:hypothetical protein